MRPSDPRVQLDDRLVVLDGLREVDLRRAVRGGARGISAGIRLGSWPNQTSWIRLLVGGNDRHRQLVALAAYAMAYSRASCRWMSAFFGSAASSRSEIGNQPCDRDVLRVRPA